MNIEDINAKITFNTNATTSEYLPADRLIDINNAIDETHIEILQAQDGDDFDDKNYTNDFPILITDLVADQADYSMPDEMTKEKRLKINYNGDRWYKATPFDINQVGVALEDSFFSKTAPYYDLHDNSIEIYPTPTNDFIGGLQVWISRQMALYSTAEVDAGTKSPGFDRQFHELIPLKASWQWMFYKVKDYSGADRIKQQIDEKVAKMKQHYSDKQQDDNMTIMPAPINYDTGNQSINGYGRRSN